jgi:hypothetical protein
MVARASTARTKTPPRKAVERDVDDRLGRALLLDRQRTEEQLVTTSVERVTEARHRASQQARGPESGNQSCQRRSRDGEERQRRHRSHQAEPFDSSATEQRLKCEGYAGDGHVEQGKEAHEVGTLGPGGGRLRVEHVVGERIHGRYRADQKRELSQVRDLAQNAQRRGHRPRGLDL